MNERNSNGNSILESLIENILISLDELFTSQKPTGFNEGSRYAYIECLEIISGWTHFSKYGINDIEKRYPIK